MKQIKLSPRAFGRGCDGENWFSCADLRGELIHPQSAAGISAGAVSLSHCPAPPHRPPAPPFPILHMDALAAVRVHGHNCAHADAALLGDSFVCRRNDGTPGRRRLAVSPIRCRRNAGLNAPPVTEGCDCFSFHFSGVQVNSTVASCCFVALLLLHY